VSHRTLPDPLARLPWLADGDVPGSPSCYLERRLVRCGKKGCRCRSGIGHGPYVYLRGRVVRHAGRARFRIYLRKDLVGKIRELVEEYRLERATMRSALSLVYRLYGR
jgi:hypothetical protein